MSPVRYPDVPAENRPPSEVAPTRFAVLAPARNLLVLPGMGHPLRWFIPGVVYEVTTRTLQERFLLRPSAESRELILGVIGRGLSLYSNVSLYAFSFLSNHGQLLLSATDGADMMNFIGYVNGNVAREVGLLHDWRGHFWGRRHRPIPILDDEALVGRLRYVLAQGVKEGLVSQPEEWPGASSTMGLLGERLVGRWVHRDLETRALRSARPADPASYTVYYDVPLTPLPCWQALDAAVRMARVRALITDVVAEARRDRDASPIGVAAVLGEDPHHRPTSAARSPAPVCHAASAAVRTAFRAMYRGFVEAFRRAAAAVKAHTSPEIAGFPPGSFPRTGGCVPHEPGVAPLADLGLVRATSGPQHGWHPS